MLVLHLCSPVSSIACEGPTLPSGVTVLEPYNTTVGSVIVYQCQQSGFCSSQASSVCGEDGRWSPDPSQVLCTMIPTATGKREQKIHNNCILSSFLNPHMHITLILLSNWMQFSVKPVLLVLLTLVLNSTMIS